MHHTGRRATWRGIMLEGRGLPDLGLVEKEVKRNGDYRPDAITTRLNRLLASHTRGRTRRYGGSRIGRLRDTVPDPQFQRVYRARSELSASRWYPKTDQEIQPRPLRVHQPPSHGRLRVTHRVGDHGDRLGVVRDPPGAALDAVDGLVERGGRPSGGHTPTLRLRDRHSWAPRADLLGCLALSDRDDGILHRVARKDH